MFETFDLMYVYDQIDQVNFFLWHETHLSSPVTTCKVLCHQLVNLDDKQSLDLWTSDLLGPRGVLSLG